MIVSERFAVPPWGTAFFRMTERSQLRRLREPGNLTQEELTAQCTLLGWNISRGTLAKIESQVRRVTNSEVELMAKALKVEISELYKAAEQLVPEA